MTVCMDCGAALPHPASECISRLKVSNETQRTLIKSLTAERDDYKNRLRSTADKVLDAVQALGLSKEELGMLAAGFRQI